jgi:hypothetical protein
MFTHSLQDVAPGTVHAPAPRAALPQRSSHSRNPARRERTGLWTGRTETSLAAATHTSRAPIGAGCVNSRRSRRTLTYRLDAPRSRAAAVTWQGTGRDRGGAIRGSAGRNTGGIALFAGPAGRRTGAVAHSRARRPRTGTAAGETGVGSPAQAGPREPRLRRRMPLNSSVEATTRSQSGGSDGTIRSSIPATACFASRSPSSTTSSGRTAERETQ